MALASTETTALEGKVAWLGTVMMWILIQEIWILIQEKVLENDDLASMLQCIDAGTWKEQNNHFLMKTNLLELILDDSAPSLPNAAKSRLVLRGRHLLLLILMFSSYSEHYF